MRSRKHTYLRFKAQQNSKFHTHLPNDSIKDSLFLAVSYKEKETNERNLNEIHKIWCLAAKKVFFSLFNLPEPNHILYQSTQNISSFFVCKRSKNIHREMEIVRNNVCTLHTLFLFRLPHTAYAQKHTQRKGKFRVKSLESVDSRQSRIQYSQICTWMHFIEWASIQVVMPVSKM